MAQINSVSLVDGRVVVDIGGGTTLQVTLDAAQQVAEQLGAASEGEPVTIRVGAIVDVDLTGEQRDALLARIGRLSAHLNQFTEE